MKHFIFILIFSLFLTGCQLQNPFENDPISLSEQALDPEVSNDDGADIDANSLSNRAESESKFEFTKEVKKEDSDNLNEVYLKGSWEDGEEKTVEALIERPLNREENQKVLFLFARADNLFNPAIGTYYQGWVYNLDTGIYIPTSKLIYFENQYVDSFISSDFSVNNSLEYIISLEKEDLNLSNTPLEFIARMKLLSVTN